MIIASVIAIAVVITVAVCESVDRQRRQAADAASYDIVFEMKERYRLGEPVEIRIRNKSTSATYYYQRDFPACYNLRFFDDSTERRPYPRETPGREPVRLLPGEFIVPEGTHCDLIVEKPLAPGEVVTLLTWKQELCVKDVWGCIESAPVAPGEYRIAGEFAQSRDVIVPGRSREGARIATANWKYAIEPSP